MKPFESSFQWQIVQIMRSDRPLLEMIGSVSSAGGMWPRCHQAATDVTANAEQDRAWQLLCGRRWDWTTLWFNEWPTFVYTTTNRHIRQLSSRGFTWAERQRHTPDLTDPRQFVGHEPEGNINTWWAQCMLSYNSCNDGLPLYLRLILSLWPNTTFHVITGSHS